MTFCTPLANCLLNRSLNWCCFLKIEPYSKTVSFKGQGLDIKEAEYVKLVATL